MTLEILRLDSGSVFLMFLHRNGSVLTTRSQKILLWDSVIHDRLLLNAPERDLQREADCNAVTTNTIADPAMSFRINSKEYLIFRTTLDIHGLDHVDPLACYSISLVHL